MLDFETRMRQAEAQRTLQDQELTRFTYLSRSPAPNPPALLAPTRCRVLKPFCVAGGERVEPDAIIELQRHDALSMQALGRVTVLG